MESRIGLPLNMRDMRTGSSEELATAQHPEALSQLCVADCAAAPCMRNVHARGKRMPQACANCRACHPENLCAGVTERPRKKRRIVSAADAAPIADRNTCNRRGSARGIGARGIGVSRGRC